MLKSGVVIRVVLTIVFLFIFVATTYPQQRSFNMTKLTTLDGLSSNTVNFILKDRYGLMWFGTTDGLNKFDGTHFTIYHHNNHDPSSLPGNEILSMHEDNTGRLWVGTNGGNLSYYDREHNSFHTYSDGSKSKYIYSVRSIYEDHTGNIWVSTYDGGLRVINAKINKVTKLYFDNIKGDKPKANVVLCIFEDKKHRLWLGTNHGLYLYNWQTATFTNFLHQETDPASLSNNIIKSINEDHAGNLWIGTFGGLNLLKDDGKSFQAFRHSTNPQSISSDIIYSVALANDGKLWVGTDDGLNLFDQSTSQFTRIEPNPRNALSLSNNAIRSILTDRNGITWIGTDQGGVNKYDDHLTLFNLKQGNSFDSQGLKASAVTSFSEYQKDKIFVSTENGGLQLFDRNTGLFKQYPIKTQIHELGNDLSILSLKADKSGLLWMGIQRNGVFVLNPVTGYSKQMIYGDPSPDVNKNNVICIEEDKKLNIWLGTNGNGVFVFDRHTNLFKRFFHNSPNPHDFDLPLNGFIKTIAEATNGDIWIGSWGTGIAVFHPDTQTFSIYNQLNSNLSDNYIFNIFKDSKGHMWVGTNGGGFNLFNDQTKKFTSYSEADGLVNDVVYKILEDNSGVLWLSTDYGISSFNPHTKKIQNFNQDNGVQNGSFIIGAGLKTSDGELFFGGLNGFNYFNPLTFPKKYYTPPIILTEMQLTNNLSESVKNRPVQKQLITASEILLHYGQNFTISYAALNYTNPKQNQYLYKLTGFDKAWNYVGSSQTAYYTNLDPGDYTFNVKVSNNGILNERAATIKIKVLPPFWRTVYAYIFYACSFIGFLFYLRQNGIRKIKMAYEIEQEKQKAKALIEQQRREAQSLHEMDMLKIKFLTNLSHEFRTPISLIMAPVDKLLSMDVGTPVLAQMKVVKRNAGKLLNLVNQLLDFRKMEEQELMINLAPGDIITFIRQTTLSFRELSEQKKIKLAFESEVSRLVVDFDHEKVDRIVCNLLSNAFKFTHAGGVVSVYISFAKPDTDEMHTGLIIEIKDTGIGIPEEQQDKIFERFFQYENETAILNQGSGIGLSITKEFTELLGGKIRVKSTPGIGTEFTVNFWFKSAAEGSDLNGANQANESNTIHLKARSFTSLTPILIVEDNDEYRYYLKDYLKADYKIIEAANGKEGWQRALADHPELIVCDISMPYMDGIELSKKLKADKRTSHIPIIILTATSGDNNQIKGLETGANDYLTKPFNFEILNFKIKNLLMLKRIAKDTYSKQIEVKTQETAIESSENKLINTVIDYIERNLTDPNLTVEDLSKHVGMSRSSLYNKLLELTGMKPIEYINSVKLKKAVTLLEKSNYNIAEIAYMSGFGTPGYFSRIFKSQFSLSPSAYIDLKRKESKTGSSEN